jgi:hypothetical protein
MATVRRGSMTGSTAISQAGNEITIDEAGVVTAIARVKCDVASIFSVIPAPGTPNTTFSTLLARSYRILYEEAGRAEIEVTYKGYISPLPDPVWTVRGSTAEENIRVNANWAAIEAEAVANNGLVTDENGAFVEFTAPPALAGVDSFLAPKLVLTRRYVTITYPSSGAQALGTIDTPTGWSEIANLTTEAQDWLKIDFESNDLGEGAAYEITESWLRSGFAGWSPLLYTIPAT